MSKLPRKPDPLMPNGLQTKRTPTVFAGIDKLCGNCQHFRPKVTNGREGGCHNGISGRLFTKRINGCEFGFYPSDTKYQLVAAPGGLHVIRST